jgi:LysM repeat protein
MYPKKFFQFLTVLFVILSLLAVPTNVYAGSGTCGGWVTVVKGDTLYKIALRCGTTVSALTRANSLGNSSLIYAGQVLVMPGALLADGTGYDIYVINHGDTLKSIANLFSTNIDVLLSLNPDITNVNLIYAGQRLKVPEPGSPVPTPTPAPLPDGQTYYVVRGDTLRKIATKFNTTVEAILKVNTGITNPNLIYAGQAIKLPANISTYIVQKGDTLRIIANRYGTTVEKLLGLNPNIKNANLIYVGQVINLW